MQGLVMAPLAMPGVSVSRLPAPEPEADLVWTTLDGQRRGLSWHQSLPRA